MFQLEQMFSGPPKDHTGWKPCSTQSAVCPIVTIIMFSHRDFAIYILDDYSVHLSDEVRKAFLQRGYMLVVIGGGITGDVQVNDTSIIG